MNTKNITASMDHVNGLGDKTTRKYFVWLLKIKMRRGNLLWSIGRKYRILKKKILSLNILNFYQPWLNIFLYNIGSSYMFRPFIPSFHIRFIGS